MRRTAGRTTILAAAGVLVLAGCQTEQDDSVTVEAPAPGEDDPTDDPAADPGADATDVEVGEGEAATDPDDATDEADDGTDEAADDGTDDGATEDDDAPERLAGEPSTDRAETEGDSPMVSVTDVRIATHDGFDRIVLDVAGDGTAGWLVEYDDDPRSAGSGFEVDVEGDVVLRVSATNIELPPGTPDDVAPFDEERVSGPEGGVVVEVVNDSVYEGFHDFFVGMDEEVPFLVERFDDPQRIVIDLVR